MIGTEAVIASASITKVGVFPDATAVGLAARALNAALADAGMARSEIDGLVLNLGQPTGEDYPSLVDALGLDVRFVNQFWTHGRWTGSAVIVAALAVGAGLADVVACLGGSKRTSSDGAPFQWPLYESAGLSFRRYLTQYGVERDQVADVVLAQREFARHNENAYCRQPLSLEEYLESPLSIDPFRDLDRFPATAEGGPRNDYGVCVLVTRSELAASLGGPPVHIVSAQGIQASREEVYFGRPGLGLFGQSVSAFSPTSRDMKVYSDSGIPARDVDAFYTYDAFAPLVWMAMERFGHCEVGHAPACATVDRIGPGGVLPVNTNGGILSEGHTSGWGHIVEMVRQLRHVAGRRQVEGAEVVQWGSVFGDSLMLTNDGTRRGPR